MPEHLNPFWFVPVDGKAAPRLTLDEWFRGELLTGYVELEVRALTDTHVGGEIEAPELAMVRRHFYRKPDPGRTRERVPTVEGSSLRGMVRAYLEALTNGWVSSHVVKYPKQLDRRHLGFWVGRDPAGGPDDREFKETFPTPRGPRHRYGDAVGPTLVGRPTHLFPPDRLDDGVDRQVRLDPVTAMLGLVTLDRKGEGEDPDAVVSVAGRVAFDDAVFEPASMGFVESLDLNGGAVFGGPKPSRSNWWYFTPKEVRLRVAHLNSGRSLRMAEFVGGELRGRKFYFHQEPRRCVDWYLRMWGHQRLVRVATECVQPGRASRPLRVHFRDLPESLVKLLLVGLFPSARVRHKLGALRALGFGSVELVPLDVRVLRSGSASLSLDPYVTDEGLLAFARGRPDLGAQEVQQREYAVGHLATGAPRSERLWLVDEKAWSRLSLVAYYPRQLDTPHRLFVYPPYRQDRESRDLQRGFARPVLENEVDELRRGTVTSPVALEKVLDRLWNRRQTIDLDRYQERATHYPAVAAEARGLQ